MIKFIKHWWNSENCFAKNPFFWVLTAGACAAAPFTGFLSLAAIPVFAGLAQTGYLPYEKVLTGFKGLFPSSSVNKQTVIPQDDTLHEIEDNSTHSHQSILKQIHSAGEITQEGHQDTDENISSCSDKDSEAAITHEVIADLKKKAKEEQSEEQKLIQLADEAILVLEWLYHYRTKLGLHKEDIKPIVELLDKIPTGNRPSYYSELVKASFFILQKHPIFFDVDVACFEEKMLNDGRKIATRLLLRFSDDKTRLLDSGIQPIPFKTSRQEIAGTTLQSVCQMLNRLLNTIFIHKKNDVTLPTEQSTSSYTPFSWQPSPQFWKKCDEVEAHFDRIIQENEKEIEATRKRIKRKKQSIAKAEVLFEISQAENIVLHQDNLALIRQKIETDDANFSTTRFLMESKISQGYIINSEDISELIQSKSLLSTTVENLIIAIITQERNLELAHRCIYHSEKNPQGFMTQEKIELLVQQGKLPQKVLQKLGFASLQQSSGCTCAFLPSPTSLPQQGNNNSSKKSSSEVKTVKYDKIH